MATTFVRDGKTLTYTNSSSTAIAVGAVVLMSNIVGVAIAAIAASGGVGAVQISGVWTLAAAAGAWVQGDNLYWDAGNSDFTKTASGNTLAGVAADTKASAATTGNVLLNGAN